MKNKLTLILTGLFLFLIAPACFAQDTLQLTFKPLSEPQFKVSYRGMKLDNINQFKGIPKAMDQQVYLFNLQRRQSTLTSYLKGIFTKEQFNALTSTYQFDTAGLYRGRDINNSLVVLSALYPGNRKKIIPDLNFNLDFSDDPVYEYTVPDFDADYPNDSLPTIKVAYDYMYESQSTRREIRLKVPPTTKGHTLANLNDKPLLLTAEFLLGRSTQIKLQDTLYEIALLGPQDLDANYTQAETLLIKDLTTGKPINFETYPKPGVFFSLGDKMVKVENISYFGDSARLVIK